MDKVLTTALLTIAAIVAAVMVVNAILPALGTGSASVVSSSQMAADRIKTAIEIIHATRSGSSGNRIHFWVKNVGATEIQDIEGADVFVEHADGLSRVQFDQIGALPCSGPVPTWSYAAGTDWAKSTTIEITVCPGNLTSPDTVHFTTANGVTDKKSF